MERAHGQLRTGFADRLRRYHANRLAHIDRRASGKVAPVTACAHAMFRLAGQHRTNLDHLDLGGLDGFHVPRSLAKFLRKEPFEICFNTAFKEVLDHCAEETKDRPITWINPSIRKAYHQLHERGHCHSVEAWQGGVLVGGLYGVSLGQAFFGESMFSRASHASKAYLVALVERLKERGFVLLDTQFTTDHLKRFGAIDIDQGDYELLLEEALYEAALFG